MTDHDIALDPLAGTGARVLFPDTHARAHVSLEFPPAEPVVLEGVNRTVLALDLGTKLGWALRRRDGTVTHGAMDFTPRKSWDEGERWRRYQAWLAGMLRENDVHAVVFEVVIAHLVAGNPNWHAAHAYGAFQGVMHMVCGSFNIRPTGTTPTAIKKHWTGRGNAKKADMVAEAAARGFRVRDDNEADALAVLHWAVAKLAGDWKPTPKKPKAKKAATVRPRPAQRVAPQPDMFGS